MATVGGVVSVADFEVEIYNNEISKNPPIPIRVINLIFFEFSFLFLFNLIFD